MHAADRDLALLRLLLDESLHADHAGLAAIVRTTVTIVRSDATRLRGFDSAARPLALRGPTPGDLGAWAHGAFRTLADAVDGSPTPDLKFFMDPAHFGHPITTHNRANFRQTFLLPIVLWLEDQAHGLAAFETAIDRFVDRVHWFGLPGTPCGKNPREDDVQQRLHAWLFDQGFEPHDAGRESRTAHGRVDFAIRGRDGVVPVELKLWRGTESDGELRSWATQAADYPGDLRVEDGYLVIIVTAAEQTLRLELPERRLIVRGRRVHVRVGDLARGPSSREGRRTAHALTTETFGIC